MFDFRESAHYKHFVFVWLLFKSQSCVIGKVSVKKNPQHYLIGRLLLLWCSCDFY